VCGRGLVHLRMAESSEADGWREVPAESVGGDVAFYLLPSAARDEGIANGEARDLEEALASSTAQALTDALRSKAARDVRPLGESDLFPWSEESEARATERAALEAHSAPGWELRRIAERAAKLMDVEFRPYPADVLRTSLTPAACAEAGRAVLAARAAGTSVDAIADAAAAAAAAGGEGGARAAQGEPGGKDGAGLGSGDADRERRRREKAEKRERKERKKDRKRRRDDGRPGSAKTLGGTGTAPGTGSTRRS